MEQIKTNLIQINFCCQFSRKLASLFPNLLGENALQNIMQLAFPDNIRGMFSEQI